MMKNPSQKCASTGAQNDTIVAVVAVLIMVTVMGWIGWIKFTTPVEPKQTASAPVYPPAPRTLIDDSVLETVRVAAERGWVPCPGDCLKLATPGWHHQDIQGFPDTDVWFTFRYAGGWSAFSQRHIGHIIQTHPDQAAKDTGICPICDGTGWVRASVIQPNASKAKNPSQPGKKQHRKRKRATHKT